MRTREFRSDDGRWSKETYSDTGRILRIEDYSPSGRLSLSVDYRYDDRGNNVERIVKDGNGRQIRRLAFDFDASGKEITHREYNDADELVFTRDLQS